MRDSNVANAAKESTQGEFSHGLHGFRLGGDPDYLWPYYYAIRRSGEILRSLAIVEKE